MAKKSSSNREEDVYVSSDYSFAYMPGVHAAVQVSNSANMFEKPGNAPVKIAKVTDRGFVPWGESNNWPGEVRGKVEKSEMLSGNMLFNICLTYGSGLEWGIILTDDNGMKSFKAKSFPEVDAFFAEIDINYYLLRQMTDMTHFYNTFPEIVLSQEGKAVDIYSKDATMCRWESMNPTTGYIENLLYSADFAEGKTPPEENVRRIAVLKDDNPIRDAMVRKGKKPDPHTGQTKDLKEDRFIVPVNFPTPGRMYYSKPYWWALFESGWYDFAVSIPKYKQNMMKNQATIRYHIEIHEDYFRNVFAQEGITEDAKKKERVKKEYKELSDFLSNVENTGKSTISYTKYGPKGEERYLKINAIDDKFKGGEYLDDSEEASNILSYAMGVHPSLNGSSPGKNKTINGTEARELFIIKQALLKPFRDALLRPFYVIKALNGWPADVHFTISNLVLTTLDKGTGSQKVIS